MQEEKKNKKKAEITEIRTALEEVKKSLIDAEQGLELRRRVSEAMRRCPFDVEFQYNPSHLPPKSRDYACVTMGKGFFSSKSLVFKTRAELMAFLEVMAGLKDYLEFEGE